MEFRKFFILIILLSASSSGKTKESDSNVSSWLAPITTLATISQAFKVQSVTPLLLIIANNESSIIADFDEVDSVVEIVLSSTRTNLNMKPTEALSVLGFDSKKLPQIPSQSKFLPLIILIEFKSEQCTNCKNRINSLTQLQDKYSTMSYQISPLVANLSKIDTSALDTK